MGIYTCRFGALVALMLCNLPTYSSAFSDLENFVRVQGSIDSNSSVVNYRNGSVFWKQPGYNLTKIFNFEGFNINRKLKQPDGTYLSLSREFMVYRDPVASQILQVWINPSSKQPNEVFYFTNDPANFPIKSPPPSGFTQTTDDPIIMYHVDSILEYENPLSPDKYSNYSAGEFYDAVDIFGYFANYTTLQQSSEHSIPMAGSWMRKSQFLPWMEMGNTPGSIYYNALSWKCKSGLSCISDDIMQIINTAYPKYKNAPTTAEEPNQTSWDIFKKVIEQRRQAGLPDIIISPVEITTNSSTMAYNVDERVEKIIYNAFPLFFHVNATALPEVTGKQSVPLFDLRGNIAFDYEPIPGQNAYRLQFDGYFLAYNHTSGAPLKNITNPYTGAINKLPVYFPLEVDYVFPSDSFYTIDMPDAEAVGLLAAQSVETVGRDGTGDTEIYTVNLLSLVFPYEELPKTPNEAKFYGTYTMFQNFPEWMEMGDIQGSLIYRASVSN